MPEGEEQSPVGQSPAAERDSSFSGMPEGEEQSPVGQSPAAERDSSAVQEHISGRESFSESMGRRRGKCARLGVLLVFLVLAAAMISILLGSVSLPLNTVFKVLTGTDKSSTAAQIILYSRLPRTLGCLTAGSALALAGAIIQTVLGNPLAAPNIIGVNSGAGFAVVLCCALFPKSINVVPAAAFAGAFVSVFLVLMIGERTSASRLTLVLAGIAVSAVFSGAVDLVVTLVPESLSGYTDFRIGGFASLTMIKVIPALAVILPAAVISFLLAGQAEILSMGEDTAKSLGLRVRPVRIALLACAAALAGSAVTVSGLLGFVGLIVPHAVRRTTKGEILPLFLLSALGGAFFVTAADVAARTLFAPYEIPVGIVLSLCGGPFFLWLVLGSRKRTRHF